MVSHVRADRPQMLCLSRLGGRRAWGSPYSGFSMSGGHVLVSSGASIASLIWEEEDKIIRMCSPCLVRHFRPEQRKHMHRWGWGMWRGGSSFLIWPRPPPFKESSEESTQLAGSQRSQGEGMACCGSCVLPEAFLEGFLVQCLWHRGPCIHVRTYL